MPDSTKPLPEPMLTNRQEGGIHLREISLEMLKTSIIDMSLKITKIIKITATSPKDQWVNTQFLPFWLM